MRPRFLFACSALLVALMGLGSDPANACGGYYGYGYGYGYGCRCPGYGYGYGYGSYYRAADVYYAPATMAGLGLTARGHTSDTAA